MYSASPAPDRTTCCLDAAIQRFAANSWNFRTVAYSSLNSARSGCGVIQNPAQDVNWLTLYAVRYRYSAYHHEMDQPARTRFHDEIHQAAEAIIDHVFRITGTGPDDLLS